MPANTHAVAASALTVVTTAETTIATINPFNLNEGVSGLNQGVFIDGNINILIGTGATAATIRVKNAAQANALVGVAQVSTVTAGATVTLPISELDPTTIQPGDSYIVTIQMTGASGNSTVNRVVVSVTDASQFE